MTCNFFDSTEDIRHEKGWLSGILKATEQHKGRNCIFQEEKLITRFN